MKFKTKAKDCLLTVRVKTASNEKPDSRAIDSFASLNLRGFLRPSLVKQNLIEYTGPIGVSLADHLTQPITRHEFYYIMAQIIITVQKLRANRLLINQLLLDPEYVFINGATKELQFLYIPLKSVSESDGIVAFLDDVVTRCKPAHEVDKNYASRFIYYIKSQRGFDPAAIEQFIVKEDKAAIQSIKRQNAGQSGFMTSSRVHHLEHYAASVPPAGSVVTPTAPTYPTSPTPSAQAPAKAHFHTPRQVYTPEAVLPFSSTSVSPEPESEATSLLAESEDSETSLLIESAQSSVHYPTLMRIRTGETVQVNKPVFRLGKEKSYVDYFVSNNNAVSRSHADIITRGNKCFVTDLNSKNRTFVNNQPLPIQCEVEIRDGDRLKLGNEEFIFHF